VTAYTVTVAALKSLFDRARAISKNPDRLRTNASRHMQKIFGDTENKIFFNAAEISEWTMAFLKILLGSRAR
jgi:hypothetical protein